MKLVGLRQLHNVTDVEISLVLLDSRVLNLQHFQWTFGQASYR